VAVAAFETGARERAAKMSRLNGCLSNGASEMERHDPDSARSYYEVALVIDPTNEEARRGLEQCRALLGKRDGASAPAADVKPVEKKSGPIVDLIGSTREQVVDLLGQPVDEETHPDQERGRGRQLGWTRLSFKSPVAVVYLDWSTGKVIHAMFYDSGCACAGIHVGHSRSFVYKTLGPPSQEEVSRDGKRALVYAKLHLVLPIDAKDEVEKVILDESGEQDVPPERWATSQVAARQIPAIDGKVVDVKGDPLVVRLSVGADDKVEKGFVLTIRRGNVMIAKVLVEKVLADSCECRVFVKPDAGDTIQPGDAASTR
jgi:hypothetical protein